MLDCFPRDGSRISSAAFRSSDASSTAASYLDLYLSSALDSSREEDLPEFSDDSSSSDGRVGTSSMGPGATTAGAQAVDEHGEASTRTTYSMRDPLIVGIEGAIELRRSRSCEVGRTLAT